MNNKNYKDISHEEIDLKKLFYALLRNKKLILKFFISSFLIGLVISFSSRKIWEGEFQIVLESNSKISERNLGLAELAGLGQDKDELKTEVGILKSPSVLMKVFQFVRDEKILNNNNSAKKLRFRKWRKESININLEKNTSILNLSYKDKDKELILPVLDMISNKYQEYSGKKRKRNLDLAIIYFEDQIPKYKVKSFKALEKVNKYALKNDLPQMINFAKNQEDIGNKGAKNIDIEFNRISAINAIRENEELLEEYETIGNDPEQIISFGERINEVYGSVTFKRLKELDDKLLKAKLNYKKKDKLFIKLNQERDSLILSLKNQIKNNLISKRIALYALKKSSERPDGVLTKYMQLLANANKESNTLLNLEKKYRSALLEKAKSKDPWELITNPTLYPKPVEPNKILIVFLSLITGGITGIIAALILEKRKDLINAISDLDEIESWSFISEFTSLEKSYLEESFKLISNGQLSQKDDEIAFLSIGEIDAKLIQEFKKALKIIFPNRKTLITKNIIEANKFKNIIGIIAIGITRKKEFILSLERLNLQKRALLGLIVVNNKES